MIRGCGKRVKGGLYICCGTSPYGEPIEHFLVDPPLPYGGDPFRAPLVHKRNGGSNIKDLIFWVGQEFYPFCPDFIEETRYFGVSKRIPVSFDWSGVTPFQSRMFFIHPKAVIKEKAEPVDRCPKADHAHEKGEEFCLRSLYFFVDTELEDGKYCRKIGSTAYNVPRLISDYRPKYAPGTFLWLPFTHFEYVMPEDKMADEKVKKAFAAGAPIRLMDE